MLKVLPAQMPLVLQQYCVNRCLKQEAGEKTPSIDMESAGHNAPVAFGGGGGAGGAGAVSVIRHVDRLKVPRSQVDTAELVDGAARGEDRCSAFRLRDFGVLSVHGHNLFLSGQIEWRAARRREEHIDGRQQHRTCHRSKLRTLCKCEPTKPESENFS